MSALPRPRGWLPGREPRGPPRCGRCARCVPGWSSPRPPAGRRRPPRQVTVDPSGRPASKRRAGPVAVHGCRLPTRPGGRSRSHLEKERDRAEGRSEPRTYQLRAGPVPWAGTDPRRRCRQRHPRAARRRSCPSRADGVLFRSSSRASLGGRPQRERWTRMSVSASTRIAAGGSASPRPGPARRSPARLEGELVALQDGADALVGAPVHARDAHLAQAGHVVARGVAGIVLPAIARVAQGQSCHEPVAGHLGHDRGAGDGVGEDSSPSTMAV